MKKGREGYLNVIQCVTETSNNLLNLIPVGTLYFYDLPTSTTDLYGVIVDEHDLAPWKWLDLEFLAHHLRQHDVEFHPILEDIRYMIQNRYLMATFKTVPIPGIHDEKVCLVRIYSVPSDITGSKVFNDFRYSKPRSLFVDRYAKSIWWKLICVLDFSEESWSAKREWQELEILAQVCLIPVRGASKIDLDKSRKSLPEQDVLNHHIDRWKSNERWLQPPPASTTLPSLSQKLMNIYNSIPSPDLSKYDNKPKLTTKEVLAEPQDVIINLLASKGNPLPGMKTTLYGFQLNSLLKMFEKETLIERKLVPNFVELNSAASTTRFYFDTSTGAFWSKPELYTLPRGGILAENMGLGKTIICLSLVCLTKKDVSTIPEDRVTYQSFETTNCEILIEDSIPKLTDICIKRINQKSLPWKYFVKDLPDTVIKILTENPGQFLIPSNADPFRRTSLRNGKNVNEGEYKTYFLSNSTLIFVPDNLFHQWNNELKKHVDDSYLNKLFISNQFKSSIISKYSTYTHEIPQNLIQILGYDLVIISHSLLAKQEMEEASAILKKIYWKRLIIDEGHSTSSKNSKTSLLCKEIQAERRWAVTGTPTSGLTRLEMDEEDENERVKTTKKAKYTVKTTINEKDDLGKLGAIVSSFLNVEPYHTKPKLWTEMVSKPLANNRYGSTLSLSNLLNNIVVRHSLKDVEHDLKLPQLHHTPVFLKPSYHNKLAVNLFTAVLAVNAVSSERTDIDYMFHPSNRQQLRRLITNLQRATFHWTGFKQDDVETLIKICENSLKKHEEKHGKLYTEKDVILLKESMHAARSALINPRWRTMALLHEMNYFVYGLPEVFVESFGTGVIEEDQGIESCGVFGAPHINSIQEFFYKNRFSNMNDEARMKGKLQEASRPFWKSYWNETTKRNMERFNKQDANQEFRISNDQIDNITKVPEIALDLSPKRQKQKKRRLSLEGNNNTYSELDLGSINGSHISDTTSFEKIRNSSILGTASSKLSYMSSRLLEHQHENVKSIVFFEFEDSAYYLSELLDILGVNYILYATFIPRVKGRQIFPNSVITVEMVA